VAIKFSAHDVFLESPSSDTLKIKIFAKAKLCSIDIKQKYIKSSQIDKTLFTFLEYNYKYMHIYTRQKKKRYIGF